MTQTYRSFAKINLHLQVLGRRDDGYHELLTVFQSIDFHDLLTVELGGSEDGQCGLRPRDHLALQLQACAERRVHRSGFECRVCHGETGALMRQLRRFCFGVWRSGLDAAPGPQQYAALRIKSTPP